MTIEVETISRDRFSFFFFFFFYFFFLVVNIIQPLWTKQEGKKIGKRRERRNIREKNIWSLTCHRLTLAFNFFLLPYPSLPSTPFYNSFFYSDFWKILLDNPILIESPQLFLDNAQNIEAQFECYLLHMAFTPIQYYLNATTSKRGSRSYLNTISIWLNPQLKEEVKTTQQLLRVNSVTPQYNSIRSWLLLSYYLLT